MSLAASKREKILGDNYSKTKRKPARSKVLVAFGWLCFAFIISVLLSLAFSVCFRAAMTSDSFVCIDLRKKIEEQIVQREKLEKQMALLSSPVRIEKIALSKIKMIKPKEVYFLQLSSSASFSYSFKKPSFKVKPLGWLDEFLDKVVLLRARQGLAYGRQ